MKIYSATEKKTALSRIEAGESVSMTSRTMKIPRSTLMGWKRVGRSDEKSDEPTCARPRKKNAPARESTLDTSTPQPKAEDSEETKKRSDWKREFSDQSQSNIEKAQRLIDRRLSRALDYEKELDEIVNIVLEATDEDVDYKQKMTLINKLKQVRVTDLRDIVVLIGTLYDKQALANNEANEKVSLAQDKPFEIVVTVKK